MSTLGPITHEVGTVGAASMRRQFLRFLVVGGLNTVVTGVFFYLLATAVQSRVAFTIAYLAGLAWVTLATPRYVFGVSASPSARSLLALWYVAVYVIGLAVVSGLESISHDRAMVVVGTVLVTAPLGFVGARLLVGRETDPTLRTHDGSSGG